MRRPIKFFFTSVGFIIALMAIGMLLSAAFRVKPEEINKLNLIEELQWYRLGFYIAVLLAWSWISKFMTRPKLFDNDTNVEQRTKAEEKRLQDYLALKSKRVHIGLLFVFFEIVVIRQFGL